MAIADAASADVVFLPGMMLGRGMWEHQIDHLRNRWNCVVPDYGSATSISEMAGRVGGGEAFHLVGFSLGAIVAMEVWRQCSDKVLSMTLIGLNPRADPAERRGRRLAQIARAKRGELEEMMREEFLPNYFSDKAEPTPALADAVALMADRLGPEAFERQSIAQLGRPDSVGTLAELTVPTLVMCGEDDRITSREQHVDIARAIPGSRLSVIERAGHMVTMEQPAAVNEVLGQFLADNSTALDRGQPGALRQSTATARPT